eukprot:5176183-Alexandrium_andersonii.AAC.1
MAGQPPRAERHKHDCAHLKKSVRAAEKARTRVVALRAVTERAVQIRCRPAAPLCGARGRRNRDSRCW